MILAITALILVRMLNGGGGELACHPAGLVASRHRQQQDGAAPVHPRAAAPAAARGVAYFAIIFRSGKC